MVLPLTIFDHIFVIIRECFKINGLQLVVDIEPFAIGVLRKPLYYGIIIEREESMIEGTHISFLGIKPHWTRTERSYVGEDVLVYQRDEGGEADESSYEAATFHSLYMDSYGNKYAKLALISRRIRYLLLFDMRTRRYAPTWDRPECWFAFDGEEI